MYLTRLKQLHCPNPNCNANETPLIADDPTRTDTLSLFQILTCTLCGAAFRVWYDPTALEMMYIPDPLDNIQDLGVVGI